MSDPSFGAIGLPWWFKLALAAMAVFVVFPALLVMAYRNRRQTMAYAAAHGWTYRDRDRSLARRWTGPPFESGSNRRAESVIEGTYRGWPIVAFVHRYDTGSGDDEHTWTTPRNFAPRCSTR